MEQGRSHLCEGGLCAKALGQNRGIMEPRAAESTAVMSESNSGWSMVRVWFNSQGIQSSSHKMTWSKLRSVTLLFILFEE